MNNDIILQGICKEELIEGVADVLFKKVTEYLKEKEVPNKMMDRKEAAAYLGISARTLDTLTKDGKIKYSKIESAVRFKKSELDAFILKSEVKIKKFA